MGSTKVSSNPLKCKKHGTKQNMCLLLSISPAALTEQAPEEEHESKKSMHRPGKETICLMLRSGRWLAEMQFYYTPSF